MKALSKLQVLVIAGVFAVGGLVGQFAAEAQRATGSAAAPTPAVANAPMMPTTFAPVVKAVLPAVVNISSSKMVKTPQMPDMDMFGQMFPGFPGFQMPRQAPQRQAPQQKESALGSGVIVSPDGYVLTNNHVIDGATDIKVSLSDKREFTAKVVGADPKTDVALLKLDAANLPSAVLGDSSNVEVGDIALAIGNPFGLGQTVTMGIVSAKERTGLGIEDYEDFIQTDASINPGNSGGALIDVRGQVIGINTAILSGSGGNQGVGFAIPVNMAKKVMTELKDHGHVTRGFMGITIQDLTPGLASAFGAKVDKGVVVADVTADSPAEKAGIKKGDIILQADGKSVDKDTLHMMTAERAPGSTLSLKIIRDGKEQTINVKLGEMPQTT